MVNNLAGPLDRVFGALSDPTRRSLVATLAAGPATMGELAAPMPMSLVAVGKHLAVLEKAGLIKRTKTGRTVRCELEPTALRLAAGWLDTYRAFWTARLDSLERHLERQP